MPSVKYANPYNSTFFTTCCDTAICDDQRRCPSCKQYVHPFADGMTEQEMVEVGGGYYNHHTRMARMRAAK